MLASLSSGNSFSSGRVASNAVAVLLMALSLVHSVHAQDRTTEAGEAQILGKFLCVFRSTFRGPFFRGQGSGH
jgi:hypothetical protein